LTGLEQFLNVVFAWRDFLLDFTDILRGVNTIEPSMKKYLYNCIYNNVWLKRKRHQSKLKETRKQAKQQLKGNINRSRVLMPRHTTTMGGGKKPFR
jgi:hypothetical protein